MPPLLVIGHHWGSCLLCDEHSGLVSFYHPLLPYKLQPLKWTCLFGFLTCNHKYTPQNYCSMHEWPMGTKPTGFCPFETFIHVFECLWFLHMHSFIPLHQIGFFLMSKHYSSQIIGTSSALDCWKTRFEWFMTKGNVVYVARRDVTSDIVFTLNSKLWWHSFNC